MFPIRWECTTDQLCFLKRSSFGSLQDPIAAVVLFSRRQWKLEQCWDIIPHQDWVIPRSHLSGSEFESLHEFETAIPFTTSMFTDILTEHSCVFVHSSVVLGSHNPAVSHFFLGLTGTTSKIFYILGSCFSKLFRFALPCNASDLVVAEIK